MSSVGLMTLARCWSARARGVRRGRACRGPAPGITLTFASPSGSRTKMQERTEPGGRRNGIRIECVYTVIGNYIFVYSVGYERNFSVSMSHGPCAQRAVTGVCEISLFPVACALQISTSDRTLTRANRTRHTSSSSTSCAPQCQTAQLPRSSTRARSHSVVSC